MINRYILLLTFFLMPVLNSFGQINYLEKGNSYLNDNQLDKAEQTFREGIEKEPENLIYQCQLGLVLISRQKYKEAQEVLDGVLEREPNQIVAIWYSGIGSYKSEDDRMAIKYFEESLKHLDIASGQYYSANWFIGKSYSSLLRTEGLTYEETDRMLECYEEYLRLQPNAEDADEIREYVKSISENRPPKNVKKWVNM